MVWTPTHRPLRIAQLSQLSLLCLPRGEIILEPPQRQLYHSFIQHLDQSMKVLRLVVQCCLEVSNEKSRSGRCTRVLQSRTDLANETLFRKDFLRPFLSFLRTSLSHLHFLLQSSSTEDRSSLDAEVVPRLSSTTAGQMVLLDVGRQEPLARPVCPATLTSKS